MKWKNCKGCKDFLHGTVKKYFRENVIFGYAGKCSMDYFDKCCSVSISLLIRIQKKRIGIKVNAWSKRKESDEKKMIEVK